MKSAIATVIAIATAIDPRAHEDSLGPIAVRSGDTSSFLSLDFF